MSNYSKLIANAEYQRDKAWYKMMFGINIDDVWGTDMTLKNAKALRHYVDNKNAKDMETYALSVMKPINKDVAVYPVVAKPFNWMRFFKWVANILTIIGAGHVAFHIFITGYLLFIIGAFIWLLVAVKQNDLELGFLQVFFLLINFIGLYNNL